VGEATSTRGPLHGDAERSLRSVIARNAGDPIREGQDRRIPQTLDLRYPTLPCTKAVATRMGWANCASLSATTPRVRTVA
jgi:hypothetical protein